MRLVRWLVLDLVTAGINDDARTVDVTVALDLLGDTPMARRKSSIVRCTTRRVLCLVLVVGVAVGVGEDLTAVMLYIYDSTRVVDRTQEWHMLLHYAPDIIH